MKRVLNSLFLVLLLVACSNEQSIKPNTPMNAAYLMKFQIDNQNYSEFQGLFVEGSENTISKKAF